MQTLRPLAINAVECQLLDKDGEVAPFRMVFYGIPLHEVKLSPWFVRGVLDRRGLKDYTVIDASFKTAPSVRMEPSTVTKYRTAQPAQPTFITTKEPTHVAEYPKPSADNLPRGRTRRSKYGLG